MRKRQTCLQYAQMGLVSLTVRFHVGKVVASSATGINPESNPTWPVVDVNVNARQGVANDDCRNTSAQGTNLVAISVNSTYLCDSVVLLLELERDHIACCRGDVGGCVEKLARASNEHLVYLRTT